MRPVIPNILLLFPTFLLAQEIPTAPSTAPIPHAADFHPPGSLTFHNGGPLAPPAQELISSNGALEVTLSVNAFRQDAYISYTTRAYHFNGRGALPGPTIRVKPGDVLTVHIINDLQDTGVDLPEWANDNAFHSPNTTGFFVHGARLDPTQNNAFVRVPPGGQFTYTLDIPADHPTGLFWYHDPTHGAAMLHVMGGLFGAFYVDLPDPLAQLPPPLNAVATDLLVLSHLAMWTEEVSSRSPQPPLDYMEVSQSSGDGLDVSPSFKDPAITDLYFVNQAFQPWAVLNTGEMRRFDLLHAAGSPYQLEIEMRTAIGAGDVSARCKMYLIALDGVYLATPRSVELVPLLSGQRASVLVTCTQAGIFFLQSHPNATSRPVDAFGPDYVRYGQNLVTVVVSGKAAESPPLPDLSLIPRADYLNDLQALSPVQVNHWEMSTDQKGSPPSVTWLGVGENCSSQYQSNVTAWEEANRAGGTCLFAPFRGAQVVWDGSYRHTAAGGGVVEEVAIHGHWQTRDGMHFQNGPFQIVGYVPFHGAVDAYSMWWGQVGDWRDTLPTLPGIMLVRYVVNGPEGEYAVRSTYLANQDTGAIDTFYAGPNQPFTIYPRVLTPAPTPAPTLPPTLAPTASPTLSPTAAPTNAPTASPTLPPTLAPTPAPSLPPTPAPTLPPTLSPTLSPTLAPTSSPTLPPTLPPTVSPTLAPTSSPTLPPTLAPTTAPPTPAPTPIPGVQLEVFVTGDPSLLNADTAHIAEVFEQVASPDGFYSVSVVLGTPNNVRRERERGRRLQGGADVSATAAEAEVAEWLSLPLARMDDEIRIGSFKDATLQPLFEHAQVRSNNAECELEEAGQIRLPIFFFVHGPRLTITSDEGLHVIRAFSTVQFSEIFGSEVSTLICGASLHSVVQLPFPRPSAGVSSSSSVDLTPAQVTVQELDEGPQAAGVTAVSGGGGSVSQAAPVIPTGMEDGGGGSSVLSKGVSPATRTALLSIAIVGTIVIVVGAVKYAMAMRPTGSRGTMVVYPHGGGGGGHGSGGLRAHLHA
ncbi:hypothetical protein VYU27_002579 [Nannochloropsis oceanica]